MEEMEVFKINGNDADELMLEKDMFVDTISLTFFLLEAFQLLFVSERVRHLKSAELAERIAAINAVRLLADINYYS